MASIAIRNLDDGLRLRIRAADHGHSMEAEERCILRDAPAQHHPRTLADLALQIFGPSTASTLSLTPG